MIQFRQCEFASDSTKRFCRNPAIVSPQVSRRVTPDQCQSCRFAGDGLVELSSLLTPASPVKTRKVVSRSGSHERLAPTPSCQGSTSQKATRNGPGTELKKIFKEMGFPPCQQCFDLAIQMDKWGVDGCRDHLPEIVEDILPRARVWLNDKKPAKYAQALLGEKLFTSLGDFALREAIKIPVLKAIDKSEKSQSVKKIKSETVPS